MLIQVSIRTFILLAALLAARAAADDIDHLDYAFEAYDADGAWIAGGRLDLIVGTNQNGHLRVVAGRQRD